LPYVTAQAVASRSAWIGSEFVTVKSMPSLVGFGAMTVEWRSSSPVRPLAGCGGKSGAFTTTVDGSSAGRGGSSPVITRLATTGVSASGACCCDQLMPDLDAALIGIGDRSSAVAWYFGVWFFE
jgi:hypothetical protein